MWCEGQELKITQNQMLFAVLMNRFGGDGRMTFRLPDMRAHDAAGKPTEVVRYASKAATGFTTSPDDMKKWVMAELQPIDGRPLSRATLDSMRTAHAQTMGVDLWGLGTVLYAPTDQGSVVFGHDGVNDPAINATVRINPSTSDAIIVLATGSKSLASQLGAEWVFWQTGLPDVLEVPTLIRKALPVLITGTCSIVLVSVAFAWRARHKKTRGGA